MRIALSSLRAPPLAITRRAARSTWTNPHDPAPPKPPAEMPFSSPQIYTPGRTVPEFQPGRAPVELPRAPDAPDVPLHPEYVPSRDDPPEREPQMPVTPLPSPGVPTVPPVHMPQPPEPQVQPTPLPDVTPRSAHSAAARTAQPWLLRGHQEAELSAARKWRLYDA